MKIAIYNRNMTLKAPKTGKGFFLSRLTREFKKMGIKVTADPNKKVDITLGIGKFIFKPKGKAILRLGDIHKTTTENYKKLNKRKTGALKMADGVIFQSKYSRKLSRHFLGKEKCPSTVIFNGADPEYYRDIPAKESPFKYNFLCSTRKWLPQKRLKYAIKAFKRANIPDSCLWIAGIVLGNEKKHKADNVKFVGLLDNKTLGSYYKLCNAMIDVTYLSACPNNVVESLVAGCPVICTNQGGTIELTGWGRMDKPYNFKPINLDRPPKLDVEKLATMFHLISEKEPIEAEHLYISNIARQYVKFFRKVLECLK
jgi:glycosyltransferase involved in cell wall biosynthesis